MSKIIGIDLGTTYSCVGVWQNDHVEIIANDQGNRTMPSYVSFTNEERLVGESAKNSAANNAANTVFDAKRLIGQKFNDSKVQYCRRSEAKNRSAGAKNQMIIADMFFKDSRLCQMESSSASVLAAVRMLF